MKCTNLLVPIAFACSVAAFAQGNAFTGNWRARWQGEMKVNEAIVVIEENGGTWKGLTRNKDNNCMGLKVPIAIESNAADGITLRMKVADAMPGCADFKLRLHRVDEKTLMSADGTIKLVRD